MSENNVDPVIEDVENTDADQVIVDKTIGETPIEGPVDAIRREIDDLIDSVEAAVGRELPIFIQPVALALIKGLRQVAQIPDNIGGDVD